MSIIIRDTLRNRKTESFKNRSFSDFWIDSSFYEAEDSIVTTNNSNNYVFNQFHKAIKLYKYQRIITNFVKIIAAKEIPVKFKGAADISNENKIVLSAGLKDDNIDVNIAVAMHEASHIAFTLPLIQNPLTKPKYEGLHAKCVSQLECFGILMASYPPCQTFLAKFIRANGHTLQQTYAHHVVNIIEDNRVDNIVYKNRPGYKGYYQKMYEEYILDPEVIQFMSNKTPYGDVMFNFVKLFRDKGNHPTLNDIIKCIPQDTLEFASNTELVAYINMHEGNHIGNSICYIIAKILEEYNIRWAGHTNPSFNMNALPYLSETVSFIKNAGSESVFDSVEAAYNLLKLFDKKIVSVLLNVMMEMQLQAQPSDSQQDIQPDKQQDNQQDSKSTENNAGSSNEQSSADIQGLDDQATSGESISINDANHALDKLAQNALDTLGSSSTDFIPNNSNKTVVANGTLKHQLDSLSKMNADFDAVDIGSNKIIDSIIMKTLPFDILQKDNYNISNTCMFISSIIANSDKEAHVETAIRKGTRLGQLLKVHNESRTLITPRQKDGFIDKRMIASIGYGNEKVFAKKYTEQHKKVELHISIDASSSMSSGDKWKNTISTSVMIAKACSMTENIHVVISCRAYDSGIVFTYICYDSAIHKASHLLTLFRRLKPANYTPEGVSFKTLINSGYIKRSDPSTACYFVNISDGQPTPIAFFGARSNRNNHDNRASSFDIIRYTASVVNTIRYELNNKVLSYFVSPFNTPDPSDKKCFIAMYKDTASFIESHDVQSIAKTLNNMFLSE